MNFVRPRWALLSWIFFALIILLVPLWRLRAIHQWQNSTFGALIDPSLRYYASLRSSAGFGLSTTLSQKAAQRFPDDANAQLAALSSEDLGERYRTLQKPVMDAYYDSSPTLAQAQKKQRQSMPAFWKIADQYFAQYETLERRFPESNQIRAQHLRDLMQGTVIIDEGPPAPPPVGSAPQPKLTPIFTQPWVSAATRTVALQVARDGAKREPDNAFFPWMETILYFSFGNNEEALKALERAGNCPHFRDYGLRNAQIRLDVLRKLRATGWEDDFTEFSLALYPHLSKMRSAARTATGQMRLARKRGDQTKAFRFVAALSRAAAVVVRSDSNTLICSLVGQALCTISWRAGTEDQSSGLKPFNYTGPDQGREIQYAAYIQREANLFAAMARSRGQNQLANEVETLPSRFDTQQLAAWTNSNPNGLMSHVERLARTNWLSSQLLRLTVVSALLWSFCWAFTWRRHEEFSRARAQMLIPLMFCIGVTGVLLLIARAFSPQFNQLSEYLTGQSPPPPSLFRFHDEWIFMLAFLWTTLIIVTTVKSLTRRASGEPIPSRMKLWRVLRGLAWSVLAISLLIVMIFVWGNIPSVPGTDWLFGVALTVVVVSVVLATITSILRTRGTDCVMAICASGAFWLGVAGLSISSGPGDAPLYGLITEYAALLLALATLVLAIRKWHVKVSDVVRVLQALMTRIRVAGGTVALVGMAAYIATGIVVLPLEYTTRAYLGRILANGEVKVLREQIAQQT